MAGPLLDRAEGLLPLEAVWDRDALQVVAARHAQEGGFQVYHLAHQIHAVAIGAVTVGWRKQRDLGEPERAGVAGRNDEPGALNGRYRGGCEHDGVLCPVRGDLGHLGWA